MKGIVKKMGAILLGSCVFWLFFGLTTAAAHSFRMPSAIVKPGELPDGAELIFPPRAFEPGFVEQKVREVLGAWNTPSFRALLADDFYEKDRLLDTISDRVPRDARVQILGVQGSRIVRQYLQKSSDGGRHIVSDVEVRVMSEVVLNDPTLGYVRLPGTYTLNMTITRAGLPQVLTPLPAVMQ